MVALLLGLLLSGIAHSAVGVQVAQPSMADVFRTLLSHGARA